MHHVEGGSRGAVGIPLLRHRGAVHASHVLFGQGSDIVVGLLAEGLEVPVVTRGAKHAHIPRPVVQPSVTLNPTGIGQPNKLQKGEPLAYGFQSRT